MMKKKGTVLVAVQSVETVYLSGTSFFIVLGLGWFYSGKNSKK